MEKYKVNFLIIPVFALAIFQSSCATYKAATDCPKPNTDIVSEVLPIKPTLFYLGINPNASFPCQKPRQKTYRVVSLFGGFWNIDPQLQALEDGQAPVTHIDLEKDWFEDLTSLITLGAVNMMEVRFNDPHPGFTTPFHADYRPGLEKSDPASLEYPGKESWLLLGLIPIDGGVLTSNNDPKKENLYFQKYDVDRSFLLNKENPAMDKKADVIAEIGKTLIFSPISSVVAFFSVHSYWKI